MDPLIFLNLGAIIVLIAMNGFFVASEFSIVKVRSSRLETLIKDGNQEAESAKEVTEHLDAYLSVTQLGITIASLGLGWIGEPTIIRILEPIFQLFTLPKNLEHTIAFVLGFSIITALHIVLGELVPKSLSIQKTEQIVLFVAGPLIFFDKIFYPAVWFMNHVANWVLSLFGVEAASEQEEAHNEEEIRLLMEESHKHGYIDKSELTYLDNVFEFSDRRAGEIMVPRTDMVCLFVEDDFEENLKVALKEKMTRYPVCDEDKDHVVGFIHVIDMLQAVKNEGKVDLRKLMRAPLIVPESMDISKLLRMMQKRRAQMAILADEYGGTAGLVTLEDILEEIVGEIQDEFDDERNEIIELGEKTYSVDGKVLLEQINDLFELSIDTEDVDVDTVGGWVYAKVEYPPRIGKQVETEGAIFTIEEMDKVRITRVHIEVLRVPESAHEEIQAEYPQDTM